MKQKVENTTLNRCLFIFGSVSIVVITVVYIFPHLVNFILKSEIVEIPDFENLQKQKLF